jgi:hypothetical protein
MGAAGDRRSNGPNETLLYAEMAVFLRYGRVVRVGDRKKEPMS